MDGADRLLLERHGLFLAYAVGEYLRGDQLQQRLHVEAERNVSFLPQRIT